MTTPDFRRAVNHRTALEAVRIRSGYQERKDGTLTPIGERKRDAHIAHINAQDTVIRARNATIKRQKAQLAEYAAQLETAESYGKVLEGYGIKNFMDGVTLVELGAAAQQLGIDTPEKLVQLVKDADGWTPCEPLHSPITADITVNILRDLQKRIGEANAAKGFHRLHHFEDGPDDAAIADYTTARLALITTEVAEAIEEVRAGRAAGETYYPTREALLKQKGGEILAEGASSSIDAALALPHKPEGVPSEIADVVIRAFDFAHEFGVDLAAMIDEKISYNQTREFRHGKQF